VIPEEADTDSGSVAAELARAARPAIELEFRWPRRR
jgi:hypothetical protein